MNSEERKLMGLRIRSERELKGYSQDVLAEKLGMGRANIANYESGRVIAPGNILKEMSKLFDVDTDYILGLSDVRRKSSNNKDEEIPAWATKKDIRDFKQLLTDDQELMFDGLPLDHADKQRINDVLTGLFWEAKRLNKETYGRKKNTNKGNSDNTNE
ncbi:helix-turn-helix transcriptional regulator [Paenibacillus sp. FSL M7-0802]|jgi:transcriptional regulator with XRE-family HTH domain|uniref:helix-turn-helix domain-containing protein n=1 Tax=Paenibacillus sp. FSL M7-0802 TaxID=2921536 RepID=UPI0030F9D14D